MVTMILTCLFNVVLTGFVRWIEILCVYVSYSYSLVQTVHP